jgi:glutamate racemase
MSELLQQASDAAITPDTLVLGCTHYPLLRAQIERAVPPTLRVIDSAEVTAEQVAQTFGLQAGLPQPGRPNTRFFATDSVAKFRGLGSRFLGRPIDAVELVDLGG